VNYLIEEGVEQKRPPSDSVTALSQRACRTYVENKTPLVGAKMENTYLARIGKTGVAGRNA